MKINRDKKGKILQVNIMLITENNKVLDRVFLKVVEGGGESVVKIQWMRTTFE